MWSGCLGDIEWGMCEVRDPLGNALKMVKKHIKSAEKSNNQNGWRGIKQSNPTNTTFPSHWFSESKQSKSRENPGKWKTLVWSHIGSRRLSVLPTPPCFVYSSVCVRLYKKRTTMPYACSTQCKLLPLLRFGFAHTRHRLLQTRKTSFAGSASGRRPRA